MSRSWVLRESLALGFPLFVEKVRQRRRAGLAPRGEYQNPTAAGSVAWAAFGRAVCGPLGECAQGARASHVAEAGEVGLKRRGVPPRGLRDGQDRSGKVDPAPRSILLDAGRLIRRRIGLFGSLVA